MIRGLSSMQKENIILSLLFIGYTIPAFSQNLVPNPSFEDTLNCPTNQAQIYNAPPWFQPTANTPDYFHPCSGTFIGVPQNWHGYQFARTATAYAGFGCQYSSMNGREYIESKLLDSLLAGKKYCVEFYVSLSDSSTVAVSNICLLYTSDAADE